MEIMAIVRNDRFAYLVLQDAITDFCKAATARHLLLLRYGRLCGSEIGTLRSASALAKVAKGHGRCCFWTRSVIYRIFHFVRSKISRRWASSMMTSTEQCALASFFSFVRRPCIPTVDDTRGPKHFHQVMDDTHLDAGVCRNQLQRYQVQRQSFSALSSCMDKKEHLYDRAIVISQLFD